MAYTIYRTDPIPHSGTWCYPNIPLATLVTTQPTCIEGEIGGRLWITVRDVMSWKVLENLQRAAFRDSDHPRKTQHSIMAGETAHRIYIHPSLYVPAKNTPVHLQLVLLPKYLWSGVGDIESGYTWGVNWELSLSRYGSR
jgi:hypothetical protein